MSILSRFRHFGAILAISGVLSMPIPDFAVFAEHVSGSIFLPEGLVGASEKYSSPVLRGLIFDPDHPFQFDFIVDTADQSATAKSEADRMIGYFFAGLTMPDDDLWVNLSPYENDRILTNNLGSTALGRDMLACDYLLKQLAASLTYPETQAGKRYWEEINNPLAASQGASNARDAAIARKGAVSAFQKVWIVPGKADIYESDHAAFITEANMKVMTEGDYVAQNNYKSQIADYKLGNAHPPSLRGESKADDEAIASFRQHILPLIEKEINTGKNFAQLRQIYSALVLAVWFKEKFKESFYRAYIDQAKLKGVEIGDKSFRDKIYGAYVTAFKKGAYDYVKRERVETQPFGHAQGRNFTSLQKTARCRYFSGGLDDTRLRYRVAAAKKRKPDKKNLSAAGKLQRVRVSAKPIGAEAPVPRVDVTPVRVVELDESKVPERRRGVGFRVGGRAEGKTRLLSERLTVAGVTDPQENEDLTRALLRVMSLTLSNAGVYFTDYRDPAAVMTAILNDEEFPLDGLVRGLNRQVDIFRSFADNDGGQLFTEHEISTLVFGHLVPAAVPWRLLDDGLPKRNVALFCRKGVDLLDDWGKRRPLFDILVENGIIPTQAARLALTQEMSDVVNTLKNEYQFSPERINAILVHLGESSLAITATKAPGGRPIAGISAQIAPRRRGSGIMHSKELSVAVGYVERLRTDLTADGRLTLEEREALLHILTRVREGTLRRFPGLFTGYALVAKEAVINDICACRYFDVAPFVTNILAEKLRYEARLTVSGKRFFTDRDIFFLLFERLIPLDIMESLIADGLTKTYAVRLATDYADMIPEWAQRREIFFFLRTQMSATHASELAVKTSMDTLRTKAAEYGYQPKTDRASRPAYDRGAKMPAWILEVEATHRGYRLVNRFEPCCQDYHKKLVERLGLSRLSRGQQCALADQLCRAGEANIRDFFTAIEAYPDNVLAANAVVTHRNLPLAPLLTALEREERRYQDFTNGGQARVFGDANIDILLYGSFVPAVIVSEMLAAGVTSSQVKQLAGRPVGLIDFWHTIALAYRKLHIDCGMASEPAMEIVSAWSRPQAKIAAIERVVETLEPLVLGDRNRLFAIIAAGQIGWLQKLIAESLSIEDTDAQQILFPLADYQETFHDRDPNRSYYDRLVALADIGSSEGAQGARIAAVKKGWGFISARKSPRAVGCADFLAERLTGLGLDADRARDIAKALVVARRDTLVDFCHTVVPDDDSALSTALLTNDLNRLETIDLSEFAAEIVAQDHA